MQTTIVIRSDDLDGTETDDVQTVTFSYRDVDYEIDLSAANRTLLDTALASFVAAARPLSPRARARRKPTKNTDNARLREFWKSIDPAAPSRGRIPASIRQQYEQQYRP